MLNHYYYNKNIDRRGNHEVHIETCAYLPDRNNRVYIGYESNCRAAIQRAIRETGQSNFDGCFYCCRECHTG